MYFVPVQDDPLSFKKAILLQHNTPDQNLPDQNNPESGNKKLTYKSKRSWT